MDAIIESYAQLVFAGNRTIDQVPTGLRSFVEDKVAAITKAVEASMEVEKEDEQTE